MKFMYKLIIWVLSQALLALVCFILYKYILIDLFKVGISYIQWFAIIILAACIFPANDTHNKKITNKSKLDDLASRLLRKKNGR